MPFYVDDWRNLDFLAIAKRAPAEAERRAARKWFQSNGKREGEKVEGEEEEEEEEEGWEEEEDEWSFASPLLLCVFLSGPFPRAKDGSQSYPRSPLRRQQFMNRETE